jgi:hypothetical protein
MKNLRSLWVHFLWSFWPRFVNGQCPWGRAVSQKVYLQAKNMPTPRYPSPSITCKRAQIPIRYLTILKRTSFCTYLDSSMEKKKFKPASQILMGSFVSCYGLIKTHAQLRKATVRPQLVLVAAQHYFLLSGQTSHPSTGTTITILVWLSKT